MLNLTVYADTAANAMQILLGHLPRDADDDVRHAIDRLCTFVEWPATGAKASLIYVHDAVILGYHVSYQRLGRGHGVSLHVCDNIPAKR